MPSDWAARVKSPAFGEFMEHASRLAQGQCEQAGDAVIPPGCQIEPMLLNHGPRPESIREYLQDEAKKNYRCRSFEFVHERWKSRWICGALIGFE
jgi:hypothetical protein